MPSVYVSGNARHSLPRTWRWSLTTLLSSPPRYWAGVCTRGARREIVSLRARLSIGFSGERSGQGYYATMVGSCPQQLGWLTRRNRLHCIALRQGSLGKEDRV